MKPHLPSNPMTITPQLSGRHLTADGVWLKYAGELTPAVFDKVRRDLQDIRAMDTYQGKTDLTREQAKRVLNLILDHE